MANDSGTNQIIASVRSGERPRLRLALLIFFSAALTHLTGGSAGREGAALQIGGSLAAALGKWLRLNERNMNLIVLCGMSALFTALFGTPGGRHRVQPGGGQRGYPPLFRPVSRPVCQPGVSGGHPLDGAERGGVDAAGYAGAVPPGRAPGGRAGHRLRPGGDFILCGDARLSPGCTSGFCPIPTSGCWRGRRWSSC